MAAVNSSTKTSRCGACILLGWSCSPYCVFAKCFPRSRPNKFAIIQRAFGTAPVWHWLARMLPEQRMDATEYLVHEATYRLRWWAKHHPDYIHPPGQGTLIYSNINEEGVIRLGTAADAIRVTIPPLANNFFPGESSGTKEIGD
jgi:Lateral organ boundaries (LOB) domain